jgi:hypothetical protein
MSQSHVQSAILTLSGLYAIQGAICSRIHCARCYAERSLIVLVRLLLSLLVPLLPFLLSRGRSQRRKLLDFFRLGLWWPYSIARLGEQLLRGELLAQFVEFGAA